MTKKSSLILSILLLLTCVGCENTLSPDETAEPWYFNSFESAADTAGWRGYAGVIFENDVPENGGKQSVFISGGCIVPHACFEFKPLKTNSDFVLRCWGKKLMSGGSISLSAGDDWQDSIYISVQDSTWTSYQAADTLHVPAGQRVMLALNAGGFAPGAMLVDLIEIELVK